MSTNTGNVVGCCEGAESLPDGFDGGEGSSPFAEFEKSDEGSPWVWRAFNTVSQPCSRDLTLEFGKAKSNLRRKPQVTYLSLSSAFSLSFSALSLRPLSCWS